MSLGRVNDGGISIDRYDLRTWDRILGESPRLQEATSEQSVSGLSRDVWSSLYKAAPTLNEKGPVVNRKVMETLMKQSAWKDLRETTQMDAYSAALGSLHLQSNILDSIPKDVREEAAKVQDLEKQLNELLDQAETYADASQELEDKSDAEQAEQKAQELREEAAILKEILAGATQTLEKAFDEQSGTIGRAVRQALEQTAEYTEETERMMQAFGGGTGPGEGKPVSGKERFELAEMLHSNPKLKAIAKMAGRMQMIALNKRRNRTIHPPTEVVNVTIGNDLAHVLPNELLLLADPDTEDDFIRRFAEGQLLQYDLRGFESEGQGPIVLCIDESGSTEGTVEKWEKGMCALFLNNLDGNVKQNQAV